MSHNFLPFLFSQVPHRLAKHEKFLSSLPQLSNRNLRSVLHCQRKIWYKFKRQQKWGRSHLSTKLTCILKIIDLLFAYSSEKKMTYSSEKEMEKMKKAKLRCW